MRVPPAVKAATPFDSESPRGGLVGLLGLFRSPARGMAEAVLFPRRSAPSHILQPTSSHLTQAPDRRSGVLCVWSILPLR